MRYCNRIKQLTYRYNVIKIKLFGRRNAQKTLENTMSKLKLMKLRIGLIQKTLYKDYYEESIKGKRIMSYYKASKKSPKNRVRFSRRI